VTIATEPRFYQQKVDLQEQILWKLEEDIRCQTLVIFAASGEDDKISRTSLHQLSRPDQGTEQ